MKKLLFCLAFLLPALAFGQAIPFPGPGGKAGATTPIAFVHSSTVTETDNSTATCLTPAMATTTGNMLIVNYGVLFNNELLTVTDTAGDTCALVGTEVYSPNTRLYQYRCYNITGNAANVVTATADGNAFAVCHAMEFSGIPTGSAPEDQFSPNNTASVTTHTVPNTATLTQANEVVVAVGVAYSDTNTPTQNDGSYTTDRNFHSSLDIVFSSAYKIVSSTAAVGWSTWGTAGSPTTACALVGTYKGF